MQRRQMTSMMLRWSVAAAALALGSAGACAADEPADLPTVTVTATRVAEPSFDVPASIDLIEIGDGLGVNLSESLPAVAGLLARDRQNYAQDTQISIRGFGARSTFGIRGVRLLLDGIPATQPDGQGQVSHFNLASAARVEVLRGPFSTLYGNSSGGVIQLFTADGSEQPQISGGLAGGSFGTWRSSIGTRGSAGIADYNLDYTHFETDGFRDHSEARRESFNGKLNLQLSGSSRLTLLLNSFSSPDTQDPLGLTREQFDADPSQAAAVATQFNTRKSADQTQGGAIYEIQLSEEHSLRVLGYYGNREVQQFLAIPAGPQGSPRHSGGVVDLDTDYGGVDARWSWRTQLLARPFTLVAGLNWDDLSQQRRGYENFVGEQLGVQGALRRDETGDVYDFDQYLQANWQFAPRWSLLAGLRHSRIEFESDDHYIVEDNPDDSGSSDYSDTTPVAGLMFRYSEALHFYGAYGQGFETPTFAELAYRPDGGAGLNFGLEPAQTDNAEIGAKMRLGKRAQAQIAAFQANTRDEVVVVTNSGGRSTYGNADRTRRQGAEVSIDAALTQRLKLQFAYTWLDATVRDLYRTCTGTPCTLPTPENPQGSNIGTVPAGSRLPGVPESNLYAALRWGGDSGWHAGLSGSYVGAVPVNDTNSESAPSYERVGIDGGYVFDLPRGRIRSYLAIDNLFDTDYIGSVIVNDGNGRYYEPAPGRSVLAGLAFDWKY